MSSLEVRTQRGDAAAQSSHKAQIGTLIAGCIAIAMTSAFPQMVPNLNGVIEAKMAPSGTELTWVGDSALLASAALTYLFGSLADRVGRKRMLIAGMSCVAIGSLISALATSVYVFWVGQAIGGIGAGGLASISLAVVMAAARTDADRPRHLAAFAGALVVGPLLSGLVAGLSSQGGEYKWAYLIMTAIAVLFTLIIAGLCAESRQVPPRRLDGAGQITLIVGLAALLWAVIEGAGTHWGRTPIILGFLIGALSLCTFIWIERRPGGMIELSMFRNPAFSAAAVTAVISAAVFTGMVYVYSLRVTIAQGHPALFAAWGLIALSAVAGAAGFATRRALTGVVGARALVVIGFIGYAAALFWLGGTSISHRSFVSLLGVLIIGGVSQSIVTAGFSAAAVRSVKPELESIAASTQGVMRSVGMPLGVAITGAIIYTTSRSAMTSKLAHLQLPTATAHTIDGMNHSVGVLAIVGSGIGAKLPAVGTAAVNALATSFTDVTRVLAIVALATAAFAFVAMRNSSDERAVDAPSDPKPASTVGAGERVSAS